MFSSKCEFFLFVGRFLAHFCTYLVTDKDSVGINTMIVNLIVRTSCKTLYNVLSQLGTASNCAYERGGLRSELEGGGEGGM